MKEKFIDKLKILGIILLLTFIVSIPYLNFNDIFVHDISYHTNRIISISEELREGKFPVLIHFNLLNGFGYANSLFYPELFLYIPAVLILFGVNFLTSYKILTILSTFFTFLFTYYSANRIFKSKNTSWIITILYGTAFYRLTDIYIRGAIGEVLALVFLPLIVCGLYEIIFGENRKWWIICFGIFGVINSHVLSFAMTIILILVVCLINVIRIFKDKKRLINLIIAGVISILLIFSFVIPYLEQSNNDKFNVDEKIYSPAFIQEHAVSLEELINNDVNNGDSYKGNGIILLILPILIVFCRNKTDENKFMKQLFLLGIIVLIMSTNVFPWDKLCQKYISLTTIQFPYRLNIILCVLFSFVGGYAISEILKNRDKLIKLSSIILIILILPLIFSININSENFTSEKIIEFAPVGNGEYKPYGLIIEDDKVHNISNEEAIQFTRNSSKIEFNYTNQKDKMIIHIPLTYYKGYVAYIEENGIKTELIVSEDEKNQNIIISNDEILNGKITVEYKMTKIQKISYIITYVILFALIGYIVYIKVKEYNKFQM